MELGLERRKIGGYIKAFCENSVCEENTEMIVPDHSPDILRIVKGCASAFLKDKNARDGKIDLGGTVKGAVLYVAEGENGVRKLDVSMPFAYVVDAPGATHDSKIAASVLLRSFDVHEINPRKISVRASVEVSVCVYEKTEVEMCHGIRDDKKYGICEKKRVVSSYAPVNICRKSFTVSDDIELSQKEAGMSQILTCSAHLHRGDTKIIGNKAIVKGNAEISYVYAFSDDTPMCGEYELPFSQIMDIEGMDETNTLEISLAVTGVELEPQYDAAGVARYMTVGISAEATAVVFSSTNIELIDDVYSTKHELDIKSEELVCCTLGEKKEKRVAVNETIETGTAVKQVLDASVNLMPCVRRREEGGEVIGCDAAITVMYVGEDDAIYSASRRSTAVCPLPLKSGLAYDAKSEVRGKSFSIGASNEINVRFFTDFDITETEEIRVPAISAINIDTESSRGGESAPSVTVKRIESACDLWSLAKKYATTVEEIKLANDLNDDAELSAGRMVLIPKKR